MPAVRIRPAARVLLLDDDDRVLMLEMLRSAAGRQQRGPEARYWLLPGGGVQRGETYGQAAHREVLEETGITDVVIGPCVWLRDKTVTWPDGSPMRVIERYYVGRVATGTAVTFARHEPLEATLIAGYQWFSRAEIVAREVTETFAPPGLGRLFGELLRSRAGGGPAGPLLLSS